MIQAQLNSVVTKHETSIQNFAELFVRDIIAEAIERSSRSSFLARYSDSNHQFRPVDVKNLRTLSCSKSVPDPCKPGTSADTFKFGDAIPASWHYSKNTLSENQYTLPIDTIPKKKSSTLEHKCLKPKAIRAFNAIKSSHPRTLCDIKYFLLNLYSSNGVTSKTIGSEHSAFTKYQCRNRSSRRRMTTQLESKTRNNSRNDYQRIGTMKTGSSDINGTRRWKRCNFFDLKNSVCGVFKSHKKLVDGSTLGEPSLKSFKDRSLPPLPGSCDSLNDPKVKKSDDIQYDDENSAFDADVEFNYGNYTTGCVKKTKAFDFAASIEKVKDCGWYWGPMSSESAEKLLANEKDGSFIVRDSSDDRYIFSLTFKLNSSIMHVRIEHGQGNFSFGNYTNFKSHTIVEFIENTVQHSKSGRYLFFQYRHPIEGPMEVQLLYPVSRFKRVQSLQHMCRFVILKSVRRDLISSLPLPKALIEYLNSKDYYAEEKF